MPVKRPEKLIPQVTSPGDPCNQPRHPKENVRARPIYRILIEMQVQEFPLVGMACSILPGIESEKQKPA